MKKILLLLSLVILWKSAPLLGGIAFFIGSIAVMGYVVYIAEKRGVFQ